MKRIFGAIKKIQMFAPLKSRDQKQTPVFRCIRCPFYTYQDRMLFENEREKHEDAFHEVEPLIGEAFTESKEFFEGMEKDADDRGELNF